MAFAQCRPSEYSAVTMKTILLLRHAKSSWKEEGLRDHARPLNKRGLRDAPRMGALIEEQKIRPDMILSSSAVRAIRTAEAVAEACGAETPLVQQEELYLASSGSCIEIVRYLDESFHRILLVGHNPGISDLLGQLTGCDALMPTAALAQIKLPIEKWNALSLQTAGRLVALWRPRELEPL